MGKGSLCWHGVTESPPLGATPGTRETTVQESGGTEGGTEDQVHAEEVDLDRGSLTDSEALEDLGRGAAHVLILLRSTKMLIQEHVVLGKIRFCVEQRQTVEHWWTWAMEQRQTVEHWWTWAVEQRQTVEHWWTWAVEQRQTVEHWWTWATLVDLGRGAAADDASNAGLGAVLYQQQGNKLCVTGYGSRTLTPVEKNYHLHSGKLEFLALKWAICDKFRDYLYYAPTFTFHTDNNPLTYVLSTARLNAVRQRWVGELADIHFDIKYRPGKANVDADTLSRHPLELTDIMGEHIETLSPETVSAVWQGSKAVVDSDVPWVAALELNNPSKEMMFTEDSNFTVTSKKVKAAQRDDPAIGETRVP
ncbi:hypothetical protein M9458_050596 [Cirrhinus mrigala]|uniref:Reverse transcriptase RNase H-like domain-containing protein n=1 Tax=Cirrhinus mrigala TaxID=683832 RepID=A0ABD0MZ78_CIRMR